MISLPSYRTLSISVAFLAFIDLIFYYKYGFWAEEEGAVMDFFSWFTFAALFFNWILTTNSIFSKSMAAYFVGLYLKLFSLAFEMITIGIQSENDNHVIYSFIFVIVLLILEVVAFGLLLFIIGKPFQERKKINQKRKKKKKKFVDRVLFCGEEFVDWKHQTKKKFDGKFCFLFSTKKL